MQLIMKYLTDNKKKYGKKDDYRALGIYSSIFLLKIMWDGSNSLT